MDIEVIYDEAKAIREKTAVDAYNKRLRRPLKIFAFITLVVILFTFIAVDLSKHDHIHSDWAGVAGAAAAMFIVALWCVHGVINDECKSYSANVQYFLAIKGKTIKGHSITPETYCSSARLNVYVEDMSHKVKEISIRMLPGGPRKGISEDVIDLVESNEDRFFSEYGRWYEPYDRKIKELEAQAAIWDEEKEENANE